MAGLGKRLPSPGAYPRRDRGRGTPPVRHRLRNPARPQTCRRAPAPNPSSRKARRPVSHLKRAGTTSQASRQPLRRARYVRSWPAAAVLRKMADRRRQRASQDTEDEESGASGSDSGGSPARGGGSCSGSAGGGGSGSLPSQRGGRAGALHLRRVESGGAKSAEESECVSVRGRSWPGGGV